MSRQTRTMAGGALIGAAIVSLLLPDPALAEGQGTIHRVVIEKFAFVPATITVKPGDSVIWVNRDFAPHTATGKRADWSTRNLAKNQTARVVFRSTGSFDYFCKYHPHMRGKVVVTAKQ